MVREINLDSILALEKQIEEYERAIIRLRRTRNSLVNVSTLLPPEILGSIFRWNVIPDGDFGGLSKAHTTSSSFAITGLKSPHILRSYGVPGVIQHRIGRAGTLSMEPVPLTWYWKGVRTTN